MNNDHTIIGDRAEIHLPDGRAALLDAADLEKAKAVTGTWYADDRQHTTYVMIGTRTPKPEWRRTTKYLHRIVTEAPKGRVVDHINGDGMNNTSANLRVVTQAQNAQNRQACHPTNLSSGIRGVSRDRWGRWRARCYVDGKEYSFGIFDSIDDAADAVAAGRLKHQTHSPEATRAADILALETA